MYILIAIFNNKINKCSNLERPNLQLVLNRLQPLGYLHLIKKWLVLKDRQVSLLVLVAKHITQLP